MVRARSCHAGALVVVIAAVVLAGCGGSDNAKLSAEIEAALKYLPKDSAVVVVVPTDLDSGPIKQLDDLGAAKVKGWSKIKKQIVSQVSGSGSQSGIDAVLGNSLVISQSGPNSDNQNLALQVQNPNAVKASIQKDIDKREAEQLPDYKGAFLWEDVGPDDEDDEVNFNGLRDGIIFAARTQQQLRRAIDNAEGSDNANSANDFKAQIDEMGDDSLIRVVGDSQQLLDNSDAKEVAQARKVKFVDALGLFWTSATVTPSGLEGETVIQTNNEDLSEDDLPLTTNGVSLNSPSPDAIATVAIADPNQLVKFGLAAVKQADPQSTVQVDQALGQLKSATGVDLNGDLIGPMEQVAVSLVGEDQFEFRVQLADGEQFSQSLGKAQTFIQGILGSNDSDLSLSVKGSGDNTTYVILQGKNEVARFAIDGDAVVGSVGPVGDLPSPSASESIGDTGSLVFEGDIRTLLDTVPLDKAPLDVLPLDKVDTEGEKLALDLAKSFGAATIVLSETTEQITIKSTQQIGD